MFNSIGVKQEPIDINTESQQMSTDPNRVNGVPLLETLQTLKIEKDEDLSNMSDETMSGSSDFLSFRSVLQDDFDDQDEITHFDLHSLFPVSSLLFLI